MVKSQIEERRIRNDAAHEEAKRKALHEEKLRQEKAKAEAEVCSFGFLCYWSCLQAIIIH